MIRTAVADQSFASVADPKVLSQKAQIFPHAPTSRPPAFSPQIEKATVRTESCQIAKFRSSRRKLPMAGA